MKKTRFTESQIVSILKQYDAGKKTEDICRENRFSRATFYSLCKKYKGMDTNQLKRLKELQEKNKRLKRMFADLSLEHQLLKEVHEKSSEAL